MTSTETTTTTTSTEIATSGKNIEDIHDENLLREMWQDSDDGDFKRQIRSRMYKLREERLKEYYVKEGQDILENILKPLSSEDTEGAAATMEGTSKRTVTTMESRSVGGDEVVQSKTVRKQTVSKVVQSDGENVVFTTTTTTTTDGGDGESSVIKSRTINKDRPDQMQEIKSQQRSSPKRNMSSSEITKPLSKRSSVDSDISVGGGSKVANTSNSNQMKNKNMTNGVVSKRKQTTTTVTTSGDNGGSVGAGKVTKTRTTVSTAFAASPVTMEQENRSVASLTRNFQQQSEFSTTTMSSMSSTFMTSSSSTSSSRAVRESSNTTTTTNPGGESSTTRVSSSTVRTAATGGVPSSSSSSFHQIESQGVGGELEVGKVVIKEIGDSAPRNNEFSAARSNEFTASQMTTTSQTNRSASRSRSSSVQMRSSSPTSSSRGDRCSKLRQETSKADGKMINGVSSDTESKRTVRTSSSSSITTGKSTASRTSAKSVIQNEASESNNMSSSAATKLCKRSNRSPQGAFTSPTASTTTNAPSTRSNSTTNERREEKVCRRNKLSRESSPKSRVGRSPTKRQVGDDNLQSSLHQKGSTANATSTSAPTKNVTRTPSKTRVSENKQPRQTSPSREALNVRGAATKETADKTTKSTEEKIMRELDILDTYLSQRSASIDEGREESTTAPSGNVSAAVAKMNGSHAEERKVTRSDKKLSLGKSTRQTNSSTAATTTTSTTAGATVEVDVMEAGLERPFTRTTYKYNCPDDHSPQKNADDRNRAPEKVRTGPGAKLDKNELESQIISSESATNTTSSGRRTAADRARSVSSTQKTTVVASNRADKSGRTKTRTSSQSQEKTKRNVPGKTDELSRGEVKENVSLSKAVTNPNQDGGVSRGRKTTSSLANNKTTTTNSRKKDVSESNMKTDELITTTHVTANMAQQRKSTVSQGMTKEEKYEQDILSRPSVFTARKATAVKKTTTTTTAQKPEPNPRLRKGSDSSPERDVVGGPNRTINNNGIHKLPERNQPDDELEGEENPLSPPKRFTTTGKYLESPGAVLKAKSLFETKAQEAARDRSSADLGSKVSTSPKLTVSRKAALFEARSRGERVSISSQSNNSLDEENENDDYPQNNSNVPENEQKYKTSRVPEANERAFSMERRVSEVVSVIRKESKDQVITFEESSTVTASAEVAEEETRKLATRKIESGKQEEKSTRARGHISRQESNKSNKSPQEGQKPSTPKNKSEPRQKSPSRQQKPEKSDRSLKSRKSPERQESIGKINSVLEATDSTQVKESVRSTQQKVIEENNNNYSRKESIEKQPVKKRDSKTKLDVNKQVEEVELKRKDSRGTSALSSRRALQEVEQKNIENRGKASNEIQQQQQQLQQQQRKEIITTNQTTLSELKSTNVVKASMRQAEQTKQSQEAVVSTATVSSSKPSATAVPDTNTVPLTSSTGASTKVCKRASRSPERSDRKSTGPESTIPSSPERRRSSNIIEKKVEAIMASFKQTSSSSTAQTSVTSSSSTRMTTAELNAVDEMDSIEELEVLLDKATDYDERSRIRGRIRFLKRKATLVKRVSDHGSPERQEEHKGDLKPKNSSPPRTITTGAGVNSTVSSSERRVSKENKVTSRKSSNELTTDKRVSSRKSSDELIKKSSRKSSIDKENRVVEGERKSRSPSPQRQKSDRQSPSALPSNRSSVEKQERCLRRSVEKASAAVTTSATSQRVGSRSNSGRIATKAINDDEAIKTAEESDEKEHHRKLSSETSELLSTRSYVRDQTDKKEEQRITATTTTFASESTVATQDKNLYSSRRSSGNLEDDKADLEKVRRTVVKSDSPSRLSQTDEETVVQEKSGTISPRSKSPSRPSSPQRSEIPISVRMKRERSLSPPKIAPKETAPVTISGSENPDITKVETIIIAQEEEIQEKVAEQKVEMTRRSPTKETSPTPKRVTSRKPSSEAVIQEKPEKAKVNNETTSAPTIVPQEKQTSPDRPLTRDEKYEQDILSRPSVFAARKATAVKETSSATTQKLESKSDSRKTSESSPEREVTPSRSTRTTPQRSLTDTGRDNARRLVTRGDSSQSVTSQSVKDEKIENKQKDLVEESTTTTSAVVTSKSSRTNAYTRRGSSKEIIANKSSQKAEHVKEALTSDVTEDASQSSLGSQSKPKTASYTPKTSGEPEAPASTQPSKADTKTVTPRERTPSSNTSETVTSQAVGSTTSQKINANTDEQKTTKSASTTESTSGTKKSTTSSTTTTRRTTPSTQKVNTAPKSNKVTERVNSTDMVTSSYGIGPVDDDGKPLFGLRALRKIKQVQEQEAAAAATASAEASSFVEINQTPKTSNTNTQKASSTQVTTDVASSSSYTSSQQHFTAGGVTSNLQSLRSNDMYGLRALRKHAESNRSSDTESSQKNEDNANSVSNIESSSTVVESSSSQVVSNDSRKSSSPKSILKKTSSFTSTATRKNSGGSNREEQSSVTTEESIPEKEESGSGQGEIVTTTTTTTEMDDESGITSTTTTTTTTSTTEDKKMSGKSQDDESWRRQRSQSPKQVASASTASSIATFSRGKVGRSSVREMSRRFEDDNEQLSKSSSSTSLTSSARESSPTTSIMSRGSRAESPSRIPLSIKSSITTPIGNDADDDAIVRITTNRESSDGAAVTERESFETTGPRVYKDGSGGELTVQSSRRQRSQERRFETDNGGGSVSVTSNVVQTRVVTSSSSNRSFLNDQSPIQNLEDVIDRMRGEDPELTKSFNDQDGETTVVIQSSQGKNLLNKFIGAQVIMQAIEPVLIAQKVSMSVSSSLEQSGADLGEESGSTTIREMLDNCESEAEQGGTQQSVQSVGGGSVEITEISSNSAQLTQQSSIASESGGTTTDRPADVTVESKAKKSADADSKSETSSTSISVECEQSGSEMKASSSITSSSSSSSSSLTASSVSATTKIESVSTSSSVTVARSAAVPASPMNKFKAMDMQANPGKKAGAPLFKFANEGLTARATSAKDILLYWCQCRTRDYENIKIDNFSSSWSDGLAFCALIHHFYPDAFDYNSLNPRNRKYNFDLAFRTAEEKAGIYPLLDTEDMVAMGTRPDWKCVFTYVQSMYQKLKDM